VKIPENSEKAVINFSESSRKITLSSQISHTYTQETIHVKFHCLLET